MDWISYNLTRTNCQEIQTVTHAESATGALSRQAQQNDMSLEPTAGPSSVNDVTDAAPTTSKRGSKNQKSPPAIQTKRGRGRPRKYEGMSQDGKSKDISDPNIDFFCLCTEAYRKKPALSLAFGSFSKKAFINIYLISD
ncbi:hypothetical protein RF11_06600 [Thelohanellus kitauei]|uniref:Uncharacterized protein n=1 Tax=Thelohanellus kitauei TaxID=669202 RepID=A0A0C2MSK4_THEKT|nr:hypothetical protein RF11_06600 [Thelohanellus kitauei]